MRELPLPPEIRRLIEDPLALGIALGYRGMSDGRKQFTELHRQMVEHSLSGPRTFCAVPRGHAKSTLLSVILSAWKLLCSPDKRILIASATLDLSKKLVGELRDRLGGTLEIRPGLHVPVGQVFPHLALSATDMRSSGPTSSFNIRGRSEGAGREPSVFAGGVTTNSAGNHPTDIHPDDLQNETNYRTPAGRRRCVDWLKAAVPLLRSPTDHINGVGTYWAPGDVLDHVTQNPEWTVFHRGCWVPENPETGEIDGLGPGPEASSIWAEEYQGHYPLCPTYLNADEIRDIEREEDDQSFFAAQYLCRFTPGQSALIREPALDRAYQTEATLPDGPDILLWDPVHRLDGIVGSANGLMVVRHVPANAFPDWRERGLERDRSVFIPRFAHKIHGGVDEAMLFIEDLIQEGRFPALKAIWIERKAAQEYLGPWLEERGRIGGIRTRSIRIGNASLGNRAQGVIRAMRTGQVRFLPGFEGEEMLRNDLLRYPLIDHDDLIAAFALLSTMLDRTTSALPEISGAASATVEDWSTTPYWPK
jgi:hypothetical protein